MEDQICSHSLNDSHQRGNSLPMPIRHNVSLLTENDVCLFKQGNHFRLYEKLGSRVLQKDGEEGVYFAVWAPNAQSVSVVGDFNGWNDTSHKLAPRWDSSGVWEGFIPKLSQGTLYKYCIVSNHNDYRMLKKDPFAFYCEVPPCTASIVQGIDYRWDDDSWMKERQRYNNLESPISIYEIHFGSWRRVPEENNRSLNYREMAQQLVPYVKDMGFTHVEFMPLLDHPFTGSWGYQVVGYFSPSSFYGNPQDLMYLIDHLHQNGIGVILDWVPSHFPPDDVGLAYFDGTNLYEHADPRKGFHPDWKSYIFNYGRYEIKSFLISSALFWLDKYHVDGLRVDGVASMLYLDYSRKEGEWFPNEFGGKENLDAIAFLKQLNEEVCRDYPAVQMIAEESTAWPLVSRPAYLDGLGFGMKWNMGWMHDTLKYMSRDSLFRKYHHNQLTFSLYYAFTENFLLSLSHDEVVHGKGSLFGRMPGDDWQKFANLRLLLGYMFGHPGKKLIFMGGEFGQWAEWNYEQGLDWHILQYSVHQGIQNWVRELNRVYKSEPALYRKDFTWEGFEWIDFNDWENSVLSFMRKGLLGEDLVIVCNFTPVPRYQYKIGVPQGGYWSEILNSDAKDYGGSGLDNLGRVEAVPHPAHGRDFSLSLTLPPLSVLFLKQDPQLEKL